MVRRLTIVIESGETTCEIVPGVWCEHVGAVMMGTIPVCLLFPSNGGSHTILKEDKSGWIQRCDACLIAGGE